MSLEVRSRAAICELHVNAPPGNVIDRALCEALTAAVEEQAADPHLKAFLFTAAGENFSYGASVPDHAPGKVGRFLPAFHRLFRTLAECGVPSVAAVQGLCLGGAFELAAFANFVVAEESASFGVPEIKLGVFPPVACLVLPWKLGGAVAEDLILTGRRMTASEAAQRGLVARVGELAPTVERLIEEEIRPLSAAALRIATRSLRRSMLAGLQELEGTYLGELMATADANEGIQSFLEKRRPVWVDA